LFSEGAGAHCETERGDDARLAVQTLRAAAEWAENTGGSHIRMRDIARVWNEVRRVPKEYLLESLTPDHGMLYRLVELHGQAMSGELRRRYLELCRGVHRKPIAERTFSDYINRLAQCGLVACERARVKGRVRLISLPAARM